MRTKDARPVFVVDAGDFAWKSAQVPRAREADLRRTERLILDAYVHSGIDAMVPGDGDLALGVKVLQRAVQESGAPMLAANLRCDGQAPFPATRRVERQGVTVGFVGLVGRGLTLPQGCVAGPSVNAVQDALEQLEGVDLLVVLAHQTPDQDSALAEHIPQADLIFSGSSGAPYATPRTLPDGALLFSAGSRGKKLGLAELTLQPGASGFETEGARREMSTKLDRARKRLKSAQEQARKEQDEKKRERAARRVTHIEDQVAEYEAELARLTDESSGPHNQVKNKLRPLTKDVADDPVVRALVDAALGGGDVPTPPADATGG